MENETIEATGIGQLVAKDERLAAIFEKYGIDYCCHGDHTLADAVKQAGADVAAVKNEIASLTAKTDSSGAAIDFTSWPPDLVADYIEKKHHRYVAAQSPVLQTYLEKLCRVHGLNHPELTEVKDLFNQSVGELAMHMKKEELMLFPMIRRMVAGSSGPQRKGPTVSAAVQKMTEEHELEGERFSKIRELTHDYSVPADGCNTYRITMGLLHDFEKDLHRHIHLENNILFPEAIAMENDLNRL
jgi:regulator of cell morphogenesis and NO signaling